MSSRLAWMTVVVLTLSTCVTPPTAAHAQIPSQPQLAEGIAACMTAEMADVMTGPVWVEPAPYGGWRVVLPLRGQAAAQRQGVQSPPPATNTLAWIDIYRYRGLGYLPNDLDNMFSYVMVTAGGEVYAVYTGGYYWLRIRSASQRCFETTVDSRMWPV